MDLFDYPLFLEVWYRPLLVLHGLSAVVACGAMTHQFIDSVNVARGRLGFLRRERRFVLIALIAYLCAAGLGALIYPAYRYEVRDQVFDRPSFPAPRTEIPDGSAAHGAADARTDATPGPGADLARAATAYPPLREWSGRFDVKENFAAIALATLLGLFALSRLLDPRRPADRAWTPLYLTLSGVTAAVCWFNVLMGLTIVAVRAL
ncbi:MAG: hypothetical protein HY719_11030 [Planctomycetes bacterium]|nr:hypothetical protein [Planctomycetota bacterium]